MQGEARVDSRRGDLNDFPPRIAEKRFIGGGEDEHERDHAEGRDALVREHPVDCDHDEEGRQNLQDTQTDRSGHDLAQAVTLLQDETGDPPE